MNDIFISYKVHNRKYAIEYYKQLKNDGYQVWFDQLTPKGANWQKEIEKQIKDSRLVICLISKACLLDDWVLKQVSYAQKQHKEIYFIALEEVDKTKFEAYHIDHLYADFSLNVLKDEFVKADYRKYKDLQKQINKEKNHPLVMIGILTILALFMMIYGLHFGNLNLVSSFGLVLFGIDSLLIMSYLKYRWLFILQGFLSFGVLTYALYFIDSYYLYNVPINGVFFLFFFLLFILFRYSKKNLFLNILLTLFYTAFFFVLNTSLMIFAKRFFKIDIAYITYIILFGTYIHLFIKLMPYFKEDKEKICHELGRDLDLWIKQKKS